MQHAGADALGVAYFWRSSRLRSQEAMGRLEGYAMASHLPGTCGGHAMGKLKLAISLSGLFLLMQVLSNRLNAAWGWDWQHRGGSLSVIPLASPSLNLPIGSVGRQSCGAARSGWAVRLDAFVIWSLALLCEHLVVRKSIDQGLHGVGDLQIPGKRKGPGGADGCLLASYHFESTGEGGGEMGSK